MEKAICLSLAVNYALLVKPNASLTEPLKINEHILMYIVARHSDRRRSFALVQYFG